MKDKNCTCGSGAHPRHCHIHPENYQLHINEINADYAQEDNIDFLAKLEQIQATGKYRAGVFDVCKYICELIREDKINQINYLLIQVPVEKFGQYILVAFLSFTFIIRKLLPARIDFIERVKIKLLPEIGEKAVADIMRKTR